MPGNPAAVAAGNPNAPACPHQPATTPTATTTHQPNRVTHEVVADVGVLLAHHVHMACRAARWGMGAEQGECGKGNGRSSRPRQAIKCIRNRQRLEKQVGLVPAGGSNRNSAAGRAATPQRKGSEQGCSQAGAPWMMTGGAFSPPPLPGR